MAAIYKATDSEGNSLIVKVKEIIAVRAENDLENKAYLLAVSTKVRDYPLWFSSRDARNEAFEMLHMLMQLEP